MNREWKTVETDERYVGSMELQTYITRCENTECEVGDYQYFMRIVSTFTKEEYFMIPSTCPVCGTSREHRLNMSYF